LAGDHFAAILVPFFAATDKLAAVSVGFATFPAVNHLLGCTFFIDKAKMLKSAG
jgi:hypothetical protein